MATSSATASSASPSSNSGLPIPQTLFIIALTLTYLVVEMAFNASLLDVSGGLLSDRVESMELYGRLLSGIAVALFVLQYLLGKRVKNAGRSPHVLTMVFWCLFSIVLTYGALKFVVDMLVHSTSPQFRKASVNLMLVRSEMLHGRALISGLADDSAFFEQPEGKAFAALFPALGAMIWPKLDKTLAPAKAELLYKATDSKLGGVQAFYDGAYKDAIKQASDMYRGIYPKDVFNDIWRRESDKAWAQYEADLKARRWTPYTVPYHARSRVVAEMGKRVGVPKHWNPSDRQGFNSAMFVKVNKNLTSNPGAIYDDGKLVASGLSWPAYVAHPVTQRELRQSFALPQDVPVLAAYASGEDFDAKLYRPVVRASSDKELKRLDLPAEQYKAPGKHAKDGFEAAQAALVPPIALWFSLLGAISHLAKLLYQLTRLAAMYLPSSRATRWAPVMMPLLTVCLIGMFIGSSDTKATASGPHQFLKNQALAASDEGGSMLRTRLAIGVMHAVEVGQSYAYPINNFVRNEVLQGFSFDKSAPAKPDTTARKS